MATSPIPQYYHAPLALATVFALVGTIAYLYTTSSTSHTRPLRRSNATRRVIRPNMNTFLADIGSDGANDQGLSENNQTEDGANIIAEPDNVAYHGDGDETEVGTLEQASPGGTVGLKELLYHIASDNTISNAILHRGIQCSECQRSPIRGVRYKCLNCPDYDLCATCEADNDHDVTHLFVKIKIPAPFIKSWEPQEVAYPVEHPQKEDLDDETLTKLQLKHDIEKPTLAIMYQAFKTYAPIPIRDGIFTRWGMDRNMFGKICFNTHQGHKPLGNNLLIDRIYSLWSNPQHGLIGFEEYVRNLCRHSTESPRSYQLETIFQGVDLDGDGLVTRADFLQILQSRYELQKHISRNQIELEKLIRQRRMRVEDIHNALNSHWHDIVVDDELVDHIALQRLLGPRFSFDAARPDAFGVGSDSGSVTRHVPPNSNSLTQLGHYLSSTSRNEINEGVDSSPRGTAQDDQFGGGSFEGRIKAVSSNGFELPYVHDCGTSEVLYLHLQEAFQELLNPLFRDVDERASRVVRSHARREIWRADIQHHRFPQQRCKESQNSAEDHNSRFMLHDQDRMSTQVSDEFLNWLTLDLTLPQNRPNSQKELDQYMGVLCLLDDEEQKWTKQTSNGYLNACLSLQEFKKAMGGDDRKMLSFLWSWFNITMF